jgi:hypothetical protein
MKTGRSSFAAFFSPLVLSERSASGGVNPEEFMSSDRPREKSLREIEAETVLYLLKDFFADQKRLRERGVTLEAIYDRVADVRQLAESTHEEQIAQASRLERHGKRLRKLEEKVFSEEGSPFEAEDTGTHRIEDLLKARELAELRKRKEESERVKKEDTIWWQRQRWLWAGAIVVAVMGVLGSGCAGLVLWKVNQINNAMDAASSGTRK